MPPPAETRSFTVLESAVAALTTGLADLTNRNQTMENKLMQHMDEMARTTSTMDKILALYEKLHTSVSELQSKSQNPDNIMMSSSSIPGQSGSSLLPFPSAPIQHPNNLAPAPWTQPTETTVRPPRIDVPTFIGPDPEGWLFLMNRYLDHHHIPLEDRVNIATFHMAGDALRWVQWLTSTQQLRPWPEFSRNLVARFGPSAYWNAEVQLNKLQQTSTMDTYITEFEALSLKASGLTATNLLHRFLAGLKEEIHRELVLLCPETLQTAMGMARVAEQKVNAWKAALLRSSGPRTTGSTQTFSVAQNTRGNSQPHNLPFKKLTFAEMAARKGIVFQLR